MKPTEIVRDSSGRKIAEIHHNTHGDSYYDSSSRFLGTTSRNATRDPSGRLIADKPLGGLLIHPKSKP